MNENGRHMLFRLVQQQGRSLIDNPRRYEGPLRDQVAKEHSENLGINSNT